MRFKLFSGTEVPFLMGSATGVGASVFAYTDWYKPEVIDKSTGSMQATFLSHAPYNASAGIYSLVLEAHDLPA